jgi:hypothetical protein
MIDELEGCLEKFSGVESRTRCFAHIVNLIAQTIIRQFDIPKAKEGGLVDGAMKELRVLATDIDIEELLTRANNASKDADNDDDLEGWANEQSGMSTSDLKRFEADVQPVRRMLVKVSLLELASSSPCWHVADVHAASSSAKWRMR